MIQNAFKVQRKEKELIQCQEQNQLKKEFIALKKMLGVAVLGEGEKEKKGGGVQIFPPSLTIFRSGEIPHNFVRLLIHSFFLLFFS